MSRPEPAAHPPDSRTVTAKPGPRQPAKLLIYMALTQNRLDIRGYIDTARKHGKNAMDVLHDLMLGRPWRPPAPAFSP